MKKPRVFLDTSALFAAIWSESGGGRMILRLGEAGVVQIVVSSQVLAEIESVLRRKNPDALANLAVLLDRAQVFVNPEAPDDDLLASCLALARHPGDAQVLADACQAGVDFFATLDREHFLGNADLRDAVPFEVGTAGDFLAWVQDKIRG